MRASDLELSEDLRRDLEEVLRSHGGKLDTIGHPTTTLEDYFLRIVEESKAHPGRRFLPGKEPAARPEKVMRPETGAPAEGASPTGITERR
jgi:ABC-2 type transport system ATP-binding protein